MTTRRLQTLASIAAVVAAALLAAGRADADPGKCRREIAKQGAKLAQSRASLLSKCEESKLRGKLPSATVCALEEKVAAKLAAAEQKLRTGVAKACGGDNKACAAADTGDDADEPLAAIGWDIGLCPDFEGIGCRGPIADCGDIATCLVCVAGAAVDQAVALTRDELVPAPPGADLADCQATLGKEAARFVIAASKALDKCEGAVLGGTIAGPCPDGATHLAILKAGVKKDAQVCKACGGADHACGGGDDRPASEIGFAASCPGVTIPGGTSCGGPVSTLEELVDCVDCVAEFKTSCLDALVVPGLKPFPAECGPQPTPTPSATPTPTETPTPTPTTTPPAGVDSIRCQRALVKQLAALAQVEIDARTGCEEAKLTGKLAPSTDCATNPKTADKIEKARGKLRVAIGKSCGGGNGECNPLDGGGDADLPLADMGWALSACPNLEDGLCANTLVDCGDVATCVACVSEAATTQAAALYYGQLVPAGAGTDLRRCQVAIGKETARFFAAKTKALKKCADAILTGKVTGPCPEPGDGRATAAIAKAELKKIAAICKACGGGDRACGGGDDLIPSAIGFAASCPPVVVPDGEACGRSVVTLEDLVACVDCVTEFKVDCLARIAVPDLQGYPSECGPIGANTPTPILTATATPGGGTPGGGTPTPSATATPSGPRCGDGIRQRTLGEDCDDGNNLDCDACPADCHTDFASCSVTGTYVQPIQIDAPVGTPLGGASVCIEYPDGTVSLPQNANGQVPTNRIGYTDGFFSAVDFENAVQISLTQAPADDRVNLTVTFDRCGAMPIPPPTAYTCRTVTASDELGTPLNPVTIICTATTP